jgi:hypothetical protein
VGRGWRATETPACFSRPVTGPQARQCARSEACSRGTGAAEPRRKRRVWLLRERVRRRRRRNRAPSLTLMLPRGGGGGRGWDVGGGRCTVSVGQLLQHSSAEGPVRHSTQAVCIRRTARAFGARLPAHDFRRTASGVRLPVHGFRCTTSGFLPTASSARLPASLARLPAHGFRRMDFGFARTTSGARRVGDGPATHDSGSFIFMCDCKFHPACSQGWMKAMALLI